MVGARSKGRKLVKIIIIINNPEQILIDGLGQIRGTKGEGCEK